jgi:Zn-dependent protease with chaperone function
MYPVSALPVFLLTLLIPVALMLWFLYSISRAGESERRANWIVFRRRMHAVFLVETAAWWAFWDFQGLIRPVSLWCAFIVGIALVHLASYSFDRIFLGRRWTLGDVLQLTFWRTVSPAVALGLAAIGFDAIYDHRPSGIVWLVAAAIAALVGTVRLQLAEGMKLQEVKSGTAYKRAFVLSREMGTDLKRVYVVPAGRGHMTNAFGLRRGIALTDNYGKFLHGAQLDFVIGHELAHVKGRHGRKKLFMTAVIYVMTGVLFLAAPRILNAFHPLFNFIAILGPIFATYYVSRHFEYAADRAAIELTRDLEAGINALASLYRITRAPTDCDWVTELFMTHPSFTSRARAIGEIGKMPEDQVAELIREARGREPIHVGV